MKVDVRARIENDRYTLYLIDPFDKSTCVYSVDGCSKPLSARDLSELGWAAERVGAKPRDVVAAARAALR